MDRNMQSGMRSGLDDPKFIEQTVLYFELAIYSLESEDRELVDRIISERSPSSVAHLEALHKESRSITAPLQDGAL